MNPLFVGMTRAALTFVLAGLTCAALAEQRTVDVSDLARCRAISGAGQRLACYDDLEARAVAGAQNAPATPTDSAPSRTAASGAQSAQAPAGTAAATGASAAEPAVAAATTPEGQAAGTTAAARRSTDVDDPANFGFSLHQLRATPTGPGQVKSVVSRMTQDRLNNVDLVLDNGQTWRLIESDPRVRPGDTVTIKRAALGSYLLVTPSRRSYRVERTN
ncbi:MAG: hypothetical protein JSR66_06805 [Proteobacteria bacterium]|nr:hypothetical protein [Pseudomonadota bacterium]